MVIGFPLSVALTETIIVSPSETNVLSIPTIEKSKISYKLNDFVVDISPPK